MEFLLKFPTMEQQSLRDLKQGIDLSFKGFSRSYGESIENFFYPLLKFLVWFEKLLINSPWIIIISIIIYLTWKSSQKISLAFGTGLCFVVIGFFGMW